MGTAGPAVRAVAETVGAIARCCFESLSLAYWSALEALRALTGRELDDPRGGWWMPERVPVPDDGGRVWMYVVSGPGRGFGAGQCDVAGGGRRRAW